MATISDVKRDRGVIFRYKSAIYCQQGSCLIFLRAFQSKIGIKFLERTVQAQALDGPNVVAKDGVRI